MGRARLKRQLAGLAVATMVCSTTAHGAVITPFIDSFDFTGGQGNTVVESSRVFLVPKFNPALGTLTNVFVSTQHSPINTVLTADSGSTFSFAMASTDASASARLTLNRLVGLTPVELGVSTRSDDLAPDDPPGPFGLFPTNTDPGLPDFLGDIVVFRGVIGGDSVVVSLTDAANLAAFTGTGNINLHVHLRHAAGLTGPIASLQSLYSNSGGQILVEYEFDVAQAPPGPVPMVSAPDTALLALALFACVRRRRGVGGA